LLKGEAEALTRKAIALALEGDARALRLCLERLVPPRRDRAVRLSLPRVRKAAHLEDTMAAITAARPRKLYLSTERGLNPVQFERYSF
jgi:hypothetical protein